MARLIDADAFKAYIMDGIADHEDIPPSQFPIVEAAAKGFLLDIDEQPTISPDEVRGVGKWIEKEVYNLEYTTIEQMQSASCSVCGKIHTTPFSYYFSKYNYCPNCGARMKGVSENG